MTRRRRVLFALLALLGGPASSFIAAADAADITDSLATSTKNQVGEISRHSPYPWRRNIVTTFFWIGQGCTSISATTNQASAWDADWIKSYGGIDDPSRHEGFVPTKFAPTLNPFYVALPFNDVAYPDLAKKYCPWYKSTTVATRYISQCKGRWIEIRNQNGKCAYAQWQDVGPLRTDHASYVFGEDRPHDFNRAGLDVSPAVRDYLGLSGLDLTDWRFVEEDTVPIGPWITYGEQAVIYAALKQKEQHIAEDWHAAKRHLSSLTSQ